MVMIHAGGVGGAQYGRIRPCAAYGEVFAQD